MKSDNFSEMEDKSYFEDRRRDRRERRIKSDKARAHRKSIREKRERRYKNDF